MKSILDLIPNTKCGINKVIVVAAASDEYILNLVKLAVEKNIGRFILTGSKDMIEQIASTVELDLSNVEIINSSNDREAAIEAVKQIRDGNAYMMMKLGKA